MPSSTPRLGLTKPIGSESMPLGASQLSSNWQTVDNVIGMNVGTVFPPSPFVGKTFRRTDLSQSYYWDGSSWIPYGSIATVPIGYRNTAQVGTQVFTTTTEALVTSTSFFATTNKQYYIKVGTFLEFVENVAGYAWVVLRWAPNFSVTNTDTKIRDSRFFMDCIGVLGKPFCWLDNWFYTGINQNVTVGVFIKSESVSQTVKSSTNPEGPGANTITPQTSLIISEWG